MRNTYIASLVEYAVSCGLIEDCDRVWAVNRILEVLGVDGFEPAQPVELPLEDILKGLLDDGVARGVCADDITGRDLFDTRLMGALTPAPAQVRAHFAQLYAQSPQKATDWYYEFSQNTDYIRRYRVKKDLRWQTETEYGLLDITINLSKPEKDPRAIAAAKAAPASGYPKCMLCAENEGYAGRINHPARQNHRIIPVAVGSGSWYMQFSPYVYYNEHCIVFNGQHVPMVIDRACFEKLLDFVTLFPHYFVGSNADLPIVGGSILSHEHFQGGHYTFAMERAPIQREINLEGYDDIRAGIVKWPLSVIRLNGKDKDRLVELADRILSSWRNYTDESAFIYAQTDGEPHNTITPIARRRGEEYELDLVLRNNITTPEHPLGVYHPHAELHHIKKENIGLIEVMGLAVLPPRLKGDLERLEQVLVDNTPVPAELEQHAHWVARMRDQYTFTSENVTEILRNEVGSIFARVLEHAGVFRRDSAGMDAFVRFVEQV